MIKVLTSEEMQELDQIAMRQFGVQGLILMENAALGVVNNIIQKYGDVENKNIFIFCGKGNNGGDGFTVARHLFNRKAIVRIILIGKKRDLKGDALINANIVNRMVNEKRNSPFLSLIELNNIKELKQYPVPDIIIDAILGTGIKGNVDGLAKDAIDFMNSAGKPVVSIDIPSGLNGSTGEYGNVAVKANMTVTMALPKLGLVINKGPEQCGELRIADISMPKSIIAKQKSKTFLIEKEDLVPRIPKRAHDVHKYSCGKLFVLAGSVGLTGAAAMCSESALKTGAGAVILGIPESLNDIMEEKLTEVMTVPLPETSERTFSIKGLRNILDYTNNWADVVLIGPGISQNKETKKLILNLIPQIKKPLVLDADGLNNIQDDMDVLGKFDYELIITPHYGELSRLINIPAQEIAKNRIEIARKTAKENTLTIILKGAPSLVGDREENIYINPSGNPGMATAGSGDVLSGMVAGFFAQNNNAVISATLGMYLHGLAGDIAKEELGEHSMIATDIQKNIYKAILKLIK
jgi:ADP-dependent NAD(P)H-hydrate dehydratase / NAD(P)H-hydrate epimerase